MAAGVPATVAMATEILAAVALDAEVSFALAIAAGVPVAGAPAYVVLPIVVEVFFMVFCCCKCSSFF